MFEVMIIGINAISVGSFFLPFSNFENIQDGDSL